MHVSSRRRRTDNKCNRQLVTISNFSSWHNLFLLHPIRPAGRETNSLSDSIINPLMNHQPTNPGRLFTRSFPIGRHLAAVLTLSLLAGGAALAGDPEKAATVMTAMAPQSPEAHLQVVVNSFSQFLHWQMMLRILLGFAMAVGCAWFIASHPRRSTKSDASADLEETKTLVLLGMVGAAVAEISKLDQNMAFVIFGIGALVRFRTVMDNPKVTGKAIMVVVVGLACGMNQWAMAAFVTVLTWGLVFWLDSHISARFRIRVTGKRDLHPIFDDAKDILRLNRCKLKSSNLYDAKRSMVMIAHVPSDLDPYDIQMSLRTKLGPDCEIDVRTY